MRNKIFVKREKVGFYGSATTEQSNHWLPSFSLTVADALTLYLWTGTRGGEIVAMERVDVWDESDGLWWTIPKHKTKGLHNEKATDLRVPLGGRAEVTVRRRLVQVKGTVLFPSPRLLSSAILQDIAEP